MRKTPYYCSVLCAMLLSACFVTSSLEGAIFAEKKNHSAPSVGAIAPSASLAQASGVLVIAISSVVVDSPIYGVVTAEIKRLERLFQDAETRKDQKSMTQHAEEAAKLEAQFQRYCIDVVRKACEKLFPNVVILPEAIAYPASCNVTEAVRKEFYAYTRGVSIKTIQSIKV